MKVNLAYQCPFCGVTVELKVVKSVQTFEVGGQVEYLICACPRVRDCGRVLFAKYDCLNDCIDEAYPFPSTSASNMPEAIPIKVREDFAEALRCFYAKAYRGVVVMCRRALQNVAKNKGIKDKSDLKEEIKAMFSQGLITRSLYDVAHELRHFGAFGAHPQDDGLDNIGRDEATQLLGILRQFMDHIYVLSDAASRLAKQRQGAQQRRKGAPD
jgi:hypothetical protein